MEKWFLVPSDEGISMIGPFPSEEAAVAFRQKHDSGFSLGWEVRHAETPAEYLAEEAEINVR